MISICLQVLLRMSPLSSSPKQSEHLIHGNDELMAGRRDLFNTVDVFSSLFTILSEMISNNTIVKKAWKVLLQWVQLGMFL